MAAGSPRTTRSRGSPWALRDLRVRDDAWARMDPAFKAQDVKLWADVVRRAQPRHVGAPAALPALADRPEAQAMWRADRNQGSPPRDDGQPRKERSTRAAARRSQG